MTLTLTEIALALRGQVHGRQVLAPGPGHSRLDRSLSVRPAEDSADGFIVHSHAGDDWRACRDHVAAALGLSGDRWRNAGPPDPADVERRQKERRQAAAKEHADAAWRLRRAVAMWREALHPAGTIVESYLRSRCLDLPEEAAGAVLRFHPDCPWADGTAPAMVAAIRSVHSGDIVGVHRTALTPDGRKLGRKVFGSATAAAIMLDGHAEVTGGLAVGEGIESCLAARQLGFRPAWALGSVGAIRSLAVLPAIEALTILVETDDSGASAAAARECGKRWHAAGREVLLARPLFGGDMNDLVQEARRS